MTGSQKAAMKIVVCISLALIVSACNVRSVPGWIELQTDDKIDFATDSERYDAGEQVAIRLTNDSSTSLGYNICFAFLELETYLDGEWITINAGLGPDDVTACTAELRSLRSGESAESVAHLPVDLSSGTYRLTIDVEINGSRRSVATDPFKVSPR